MKVLTRRDVVLPKRAPDSHKGQNGKVLVIGGSQEYAGAPFLVAMAALRSGADLVRVAAPEKVAWAINAMSPDLITLKLEGNTLGPAHAALLAEEVRWADVVVMGNGLGDSTETLTFAREMLSLPHEAVWVLDADALKAITPETPLSRAILTPHHGELRTLCAHAGIELSLSGKMEKDAPSLQSALRPLLARDNVLLLKGKVDLILSSREGRLNRTGNARMTVGGTGDVLAGLCAGLAAQHIPHFSAACAAAFFNGWLGDQLFKSMGNGFLASDLADSIPAIFR